MRVIDACLVAILLEPTIGNIDSSVPGCAVRCWENTKYVSKCLDNPVCLCSEAEYQAAVYQCVYSQCDTVHFGSALHHTISLCPGINNEVLFAVPAPDRDSLRRREEEYIVGAKLFGSGSAIGFPTESVILPTQSANNYPTQSVHYPMQSAGEGFTASATALLPASLPHELDPSPVIATATATEPMFNIVPASAPSEQLQPQLFTGTGLSFRPFVPATVFLILFGICWAI